MRALTLTQPWAGLVASGIKLVENRPRPMIKREDFGQPFAIHASREIDEKVYGRIADIAPELKAEISDVAESLWYPLSRITSAVIAVATIDKVVHLGKNENPLFARQGDIPPDQHRWLFGPVGYVLRDVHALTTPVPCRGAQGFWHLTPRDERERGELSQVERSVLEQLR